MFKWWMFLLTSNSLCALTTLQVTQSSDNLPGGIGEPGDLRYALNAMNQDLNATPDDYAIVFDFPMTVTLNGILPIINNSPHAVNITIGNSDFPVIIDGNSGAYSGFFIPAGNVTIQNMVFQNLTARGGDGGDGISGGGGGMGAGGAIYVPQSFLNGSYPAVTLINVSIDSCSAEGGHGGSYMTSPSSSGNEGGGGGGGFSGNGGSITVSGICGGGGGGGFGGDGGSVTLSTSDPSGGGGGGGGGIGSRATIGTPTNLGMGGSDESDGLSGNGYGLAMATGGAGGGGHSGGASAGGGGGGNGTSYGGGGGGSAGFNGQSAEGSIPPGGGATPSGGNGGDGGGGGGGGVVITNGSNGFDGQAGSGGYGGGGGGGAGTGASDTSYTVQGGSGGVGGGGGGGGVNQSGSTSAEGGNSQGGGGGGGGGPSNGPNASGGSDTQFLGGGSGGSGANSVGMGFGGGGGGGGSGLGGAIFVDSGLNLTIQAFSGTPTVFNTVNCTTQAGAHGTAGSGGGTDGTDGSALGNSIFLRTGSSLTFLVSNPGDLLTLGDQVAFTDDTVFGAGGGTSIFVTGNGTVVYNGTTDYQGTITINNAEFKVNGTIQQADIFVCRNIGLSAQRGMLSGIGTLTGDVFVNSGTIFPDNGGTLNLGSLTLSPANPGFGTLGSLVHIAIDSAGTSLVAVSGAVTLAGTLEIDLEASATPGTYTILTSSGITGTFDSVTFTGTIPNYVLSYLPLGSPTFVQFDFLGYHSALSTQGIKGNNLKVANYLNSLSAVANSLGLTAQFDLLNDLSFSEYQKALESISPARNSIPAFVAQNTMFMLSESLDSHFTKRRLARNATTKRYVKETAFVGDNAFMVWDCFVRKTMYTPPENASSQVWAMGFGQFSNQDSQDQTPGFGFDSGGFFVAYDYGNSDQGCIGALGGYAHSSVHENHSMGNSQLNAGYLSLYGTRYFSDFFIDGAIWGNYMSVNQKRIISYSGFKGTAKSSYHAGQINPHFGTGYDFNIDTITIEPFALLDWVFEWDPSYSEKGAAPYNMKIPSKTSSMLRFETGLNGYKTATYSSGVLIVQTKLSYVYKKPYHVGHVNAAIVNAPGSFFVEAFTTEQSLVSPAIELFWQTRWNAYGSIRYNGEFGSGYNSNQFYGKIGYSF